MKDSIVTVMPTYCNSQLLYMRWCHHYGELIDIWPNPRRLFLQALVNTVLKPVEWNHNISGNPPLSTLPDSRHSRTRLVYPRIPTFRETLRDLQNGVYSKIPFSRHMTDAQIHFLAQRCPDGSLALAHCENRSLEYLDLWVCPQLRTDSRNSHAD